MNNLIIGITGRKRAGKSTIADILPTFLTHYPNLYKIGISDEIKQTLASYTGGSVAKIEENKDILRPVLQQWGDIIRERLLDILNAKVKKLQEPYLLIIPDVRLLDEVKFLREVLGSSSDPTKLTDVVILKVERREIDSYGHYLPLEFSSSISGLSSVDNHITETEVDRISFDYLIQNNLSIDYLWKTECNGFAFWLRNRKQ